MLHDAMVRSLAIAIGVASGAVVQNAQAQQGIPLGPFDLTSTLSVTAGYDDNPDAVPDGGVPQQGVRKEGSFFSVVSPTLRLDTRTQRHAFFVTSGASFEYFENQPDLNAPNWFVATGGRWDVSRTFRLNGGFDYRRVSEDVDDPDRRDFTERTEFNRFGFNWGANQDFRRTFFRYSGSLRRDDYPTLRRNGVDLNAGRDLSVIAQNIRIGYRADRQYDLFVQFGHRLTRYDENPGRNRDQQNYDLRVGSSFNIDRGLTGDISVGIGYTEFQDGVTDDKLRFSFDAGLSWAMTERTTLGFTGSNAVLPTTAAGASGRLRTTVGLTAAHQLSRQTGVGANLRYERDDFLNTDRLDDIYRAGIFAVYNFNQYFDLRAAYDYEKRVSDRALREFTRNRVVLTLTGRY